MHYNGKGTVLNSVQITFLQQSKTSFPFMSQGKTEWKHSGFYSDRPLCYQLHEE